MKKIKLSQTHLKEMIKKVLAEDNVEKKECPKGMYWCNIDKICKPDSQRISDLKSTEEEVGEAVGFIKTYSGELQDHLDAFIDVVCGYIKEQVDIKELHGDEVIVQRLYALLAEKGELHSPLQELIDIIDSLPDKETRTIGFRTQAMKEQNDSKGIKKELYKTLKLAKKGEFGEQEERKDSLLE